MTGTLLNTGAVVVGTVCGRLLGDRLPVRVRETQTAAVGLVTVALGMQNVFTVFALGHPPREFLAVLAALILGAWLGEALRIDSRIEAVESTAAARFPGQGTGGMVGAFVTTSLLFCVGPLTILGAFDDGLRGDITKLTVKSVLDGVSAMAFAATLGWGVLLSAATVLFFQGALTFGAGTLRPLLSDAMVAVMTGTGGVMLLGLGLNILGVTRIRIACLLPSLVLGPFLLVLLVRCGI